MKQTAKLLLLLAALCLIGCEKKKVNIEITPAVTPTPETTATPMVTATPSPTEAPTPTKSYRKEDKYEKDRQQRDQQREEERLALLVSPTPGPDPYVLLGTKREVQVGDVVTMGEYCHGCNPDYSFEARFPVKWLVLDKADGKALLLSLYNLSFGSYYEEASFYFDCMLGHIINPESLIAEYEGHDYYEQSKFEEKSIPVTWKTSKARFELEMIYLSAFSDEEASCILPTNVHTPGNPVYGTDGGEDTVDYLFLLSVEEAQKYFSSDGMRRTQIIPDVETNDYVYVTDYYSYQKNTTDFYGWWLRSPGEWQDYAAYVGRFGDVNLAGDIAMADTVSYRPAMWVDLSKVRQGGLQ